MPLPQLGTNRIVVIPSESQREQAPFPTCYHLYVRVTVQLERTADQRSRALHFTGGLRPRIHQLRWWIVLLRSALKFGHFGAARRKCPHRKSAYPTPTGLRPVAHGCRTRLPWVRPNDFSNPNGVAPRSPGLPYSATLGKTATTSPTPTGLRPVAQGCRTRLPWVRP